MVALTPMDAGADTNNSAVGVSVTVATTCSITANPLAFGTYSSAQVDVTGMINVTCSNSAPYTIYLDAGAGPGATENSRVMVSGAQVLTYTLYSTLGARGGGGPIVWGTGGRGGGGGVSGAGTGTNQVFSVYGRIFPGQLVTPGTYTDTVIATINY